MTEVMGVLKDQISQLGIPRAEKYEFEIKERCSREILARVGGVRSRSDWAPASKKNLEVRCLQQFNYNVFAEFGF
jgi:hypothetical protein